MTAEEGRRLELSACDVDLAGLVARWPDGDRALRPMEAKLLAFLASSGGRVVDRADLLREVWGYRGGVVSRTVKVTISRLRSKIERDPSSPEHLVTVPGAGYRFDAGGHRPAAAPSTADDAATDPEPGAASSAAPGNLPRLAPDLVGRDGARDRLLRLFAAEPGALVSLVGPGGAGKTSLSLAVAVALRDAADRSAVWLAELESCGAPGDVAIAVGRTIGLSPSPGTTEELQGRVAGALAGRGSALLVLDNAEQVLDDVAALVVEIGRRCPDVGVLVTSREPLGLGNEQVVRLGGLGPDEAQALLALRSGPERLSAWRDPARTRPVLELLDGLPLAIELAAGWAAFLSPEDVASQLSGRLELLQTRRRDRPSRHASLESSIGLSWDRLDEWEREVLARAAVFAGGFSVNDARTVVGEVEGAPEPAALHGLRRLLAASLVHRVGDGEARGGPTFRLFASVRTFARDRAPRGLSEARHGDLFAARGTPVALRALDTTAVAAELEELCGAAGDLRAALERATERDDPGTAIACCRALFRLVPWAVSSETWLADADRCVDHGGAWSAERVLLLAESSTACRGWGRSAEALERARRAYARADAMGEDALICYTLRLQSDQLRTSDMRQAHRLAVQAHALATQVGDRRLLGQALASLGMTELNLGEAAAAELHIQSAVGLLREERDAPSEVAALLFLATLDSRMRRYDRVQATLERARDLEQRRGHVRLTVVLRLGRSLRHQGRWAEAVVQLEEGLQTARQQGALTMQAFLLGELGEVERLRGCPAAGRPRLIESLELFRQQRHRSGATVALVYLAFTALDLGRADEAERRLEELQEEGAELGWSIFDGVVGAVRAGLHAARGELAQARREFAAAVAQAEEHGDRALLVELLERWAEVEAEAGDPVRSGTLYERLDVASAATVADRAAPL